MDLFKKLLPYIIFMIIGGALVYGIINRHNKAAALQAELDTYKRQVAGQLTEKEKQLESANLELGVAQSQFLTADQLEKQYKAESEKANKDLEDFKKKYNLEITALQHTITSLEQQINNGTTIVHTDNKTDKDPKTENPTVIDTSKQKISYEWKSNDGRFDLTDPDIFTPNNETFKLKQQFRITGEIFREKEGFLETSRLRMEEVIEDGKNKDGSIKYKTVNQAKVVSSDFKYSERSPEQWVYKKGVFVLRGIVSASFGLAISGPNVSPRFLLGTGLSFLEYKGFNLATQIFIDTNVIQNTGIGLSLIYRPSYKNTQFNFGFGLSAHTPFSASIGRDWTVSPNLVFYLW